jgi:hypothetical protein
MRDGYSGYVHSARGTCLVCSPLTRLV